MILRVGGPYPRKEKEEGHQESSQRASCYHDLVSAIQAW